MLLCCILGRNRQEIAFFAQVPYILLPNTTDFVFDGILKTTIVTTVFF